AGLDEAALPDLWHDRLFAGRHPPAMCRPAGRPAPAEGQAAEGAGWRLGRPARGRSRDGRRRGLAGTIPRGEPVCFRLRAGAISPNRLDAPVAGRKTWGVPEEAVDP